MNLSHRLILLTTLLMPAIVQAEGMQIGIGIFTLAQGADFQINYRPPQSHYQFGYKFTRWTDVFHDPYTGRGLSETAQSFTGPILNYLLHPESADTYYLGVSLLKWSKTETQLMVPAGQTIAPVSVSTTDFYFGGGYTKSFGQFGYYNLGLYLSPSAKLATQTAVSSTNDSGGFDIQIQVGVAF